MKAMAGRTVYQNGSYAPTRGQVSAAGAQGYLQRELLKKQAQAAMGLQGNKNLYGGVSTVGNDGQSDTRSGAAAKMLAAKQGFTPSVAGTGAGNGTPINPHHPIKLPEVPVNGGPTDTGNPGNTNTGPTDTGGPGGTNTGSGTGTPSVPTAPPPPQVSVNPDGTLNLPYDPSFGTAAAAATAQLNQHLMDLQLQQQQQQMNYTKGQRDLGLQYDQAKRDTLNNAAANGAAFSSMYGHQVSENARDYNNGMGDLNNENNSFMNWVLQSKFGIQNDYNGMMQAASAELAQRLAEQAQMRDLYLSMQQQQQQPAPTPAPAPTPPTNGGGSGNGNGKHGGGGHKHGGGGGKHGGGGGNGGGRTHGGGSGGRPTTKKHRGK